MSLRFPRGQWINPLRWRHNERDSVSNNQPHDCLLNRLFRRRSKKTSKLRVTGLCVGNSLGTGEFPAQMASYAENVSIWWRHHAKRGGTDVNGLENSHEPETIDRVLNWNIAIYFCQCQPLAFNVNDGLNAGTLNILEPFGGHITSWKHEIL